MAIPAIRVHSIPASVLIVDRDPEILDLARRTLVSEGYRILTTSSHTEARWLIENDRIELVLSDELDLFVDVRCSKPDAIRILMATPCLDAAMRAINEAAVHRYLTKPWNPTVLREMLRDVLAGRLLAADLSPRHRQMLDAVMTGASEKQIADKLGISPHTAHQYIKELFRHFGVTSRPELMARMFRR